MQPKNLLQILLYILIILSIYLFFISLNYFSLNLFFIILNYFNLYRFFLFKNILSFQISHNITEIDLQSFSYFY